MLSCLQKQLPPCFASLVLSGWNCAGREGAVPCSAVPCCWKHSLVFPHGLWPARLMQVPPLGTGVTQVPHWAGLALPGCSRHRHPAPRPVLLIPRVLLGGTPWKSGIIPPGGSSGVLVTVPLFLKRSSAAMHWASNSCFPCVMGALLALN